MVDNPRFHTDDSGLLTITFDNPTRGNALDRDGAPVCWGDNHFRQLGYRGVERRLEPGEVSEIP